MRTEIARQKPSWFSRFDPFDNIGLALSPVLRFFRRNGDRLLMAFAAVAIACVTPIPAWGIATKSGLSAGVKYWTGSKLGLGAFAGFAVGAQQKVQKMPFRYGTVRRRINIGTYAVNPGAAIPSIVIPQVGMMARILVDIEGTYTKANASGTNLLDGYDAILNRARVGLNNGSANLVDLSGVGINILNRDLSPALPVKRGLVTTAGAQAFSYKFILPINANTRRQFEMGLINLQAPELRANIDLSFNSLSSVFATPADVTLFTATANVSYEYFEIPDLAMYDLPPLTIVRSIEEAPVAIAAVGDQIYQIPRLGTMIDYHAVMVLNNLYASVLTNVNQFQWRYNKSDVQYSVKIGDWETYEAELYGVNATGTNTFLFANAISFNLWSAGDRDWNGGDFRDCIDTEENTTTESIVTVNQGTALNAGKDNFYHVRRVVQRIVQAPAPAAA